MDLVQPERLLGQAQIAHQLRTVAAYQAGAVTNMCCEIQAGVRPVTDTTGAGGADGNDTGGPPASRERSTRFRFRP